MDWVVEIISLIDNVYPTTVKAKMTVSIDDLTIKEAVDLRNNEGFQKTKLDIGGEEWKEVLDGGSKRVVNIAKGDVIGGRWEAGVGVKYESEDAEESGLELVSGGDKWSMVGAPLKSDDS